MYQINSGDLRGQIGSNQGEASIFHPYQTDYFTHQTAVNQYLYNQKIKEQQALRSVKIPDVPGMKDIRDADIPVIKEDADKIFNFMAKNGEQWKRGNPQVVSQLNRMMQDHYYLGLQSQNRNELEKTYGSQLANPKNEFEPESHAYHAESLKTPITAGIPFDPTKYELKFDITKHEKEKMEQVKNIGRSTIEKQTGIDEITGAPIYTTKEGNVYSAKSLADNAFVNELTPKVRAYYKTPENYYDKVYKPYVFGGKETLQTSGGNSSSGYGKDNNYGVTSSTGTVNTNVLTTVKDKNGNITGSMTKPQNVVSIGGYQTETGAEATLAFGKDAILQSPSANATPEEHAKEIDNMKKQVQAGTVIIGNSSIMPVWKPGTIVDGVDVGGTLVTAENTIKPSQRQSIDYQLRTLVVPKDAENSKLKASYLRTSDVAPAASKVDKNFNSAYKILSDQEKEAKKLNEQGYVLDHNKNTWIQYDKNNKPTGVTKPVAGNQQGNSTAAPNGKQSIMIAGKKANWDGSKYVFE